MPESVTVERVFPTPTVTYVTTSRQSCRKLLDEVHLMTQLDADPKALLGRIKARIEDWRAGA